MAAPTGRDKQLEVYIRSKFGFERGKGPRVTLGQAVCRFIEQLTFPVDIPDPVDDICGQYGITDYIPSKIGENTFYWLTTNKTVDEDNYQKTSIMCLSEGGTIEFPGSRLQKSQNQPGVVRVVVESAPTQRAMEVAQRLWSLFYQDVSFQAFRTQRDLETGLLSDTDELDLVVHSCFPADDEPQVTEVSESGIAKVTFRLRLIYSRV